MLVGLIAGAAAIALTSVAQSHFVDAQGRWFFRGYTVGNADGTNKSDPVNIFFFRGSAALTNIDGHIHTHAGLADVCRRHAGPVCLARCPGSAQYLTFVNRGHPPSAPATDVDEADLVRETECADENGETRHHIRVWDDLEHAQHTTGHGALDQWAPAAIHQDVNVNGEHEPTAAESWETSERWLLRKLASHCQYPHWRVLPGSTGPRRRFRGRFSDGYVSLVTMVHTSAPGRCPAP